jgi:hypothetical protein
MEAGMCVCVCVCGEVGVGGWGSVGMGNLERESGETNDFTLKIYGGWDVGGVGDGWVVVEVV